jgi:hypothetical protein
MNRARVAIVLIMPIVLAITLAGAFLTRGVMEYLLFLQARKGSIRMRSSTAERIPACSQGTFRRLSVGHYTRISQGEGCRVERSAGTRKQQQPGALRISKIKSRCHSMEDFWPTQPGSPVLVFERIASDVPVSRTQSG